MNTVIFGGSFNPVHIGHLYLADEILNQLEYEQIIFVPSFISAHKISDKKTEPFHRINMLKKAVFTDSCIVDDCEIKRGGVSYSIDTLDFLLEKYEITGNPGLVIGDDLVTGFSNWKKADDLVKKSDLIVIHRKFSEELPLKYPHRYLNNILLPVSSSDIRSRVKKGKSFRTFVPESVYNYITENQLYRD